MRLELTGRHVTITPTIRAMVEQQLAHILRMLNDSAVSGQIVLTKEKARVACDATIHARGDKFLHGAGGGRDVEAALGAALAKIDSQAQKLKGKWAGRKRHGVPAPAAVAALSSRTPRATPSADMTPADHPRVIRARRYAVKPMTIDEAAMQVDADRSPFLVFRDARTDEVAVLFRRPDGNFGLIEP